MTELWALIKAMRKYAPEWEDSNDWQQVKQDPIFGKALERRSAGQLKDKEHNMRKSVLRIWKMCKRVDVVELKQIVGSPTREFDGKWDLESNELDRLLSYEYSVEWLDPCYMAKVREGCEALIKAEEAEKKQSQLIRRRRSKAPVSLAPGMTAHVYVCLCVLAAYAVSSLCVYGSYEMEIV
jgi:hypothetical protein